MEFSGGFAQIVTDSARAGWRRDRTPSRVLILRTTPFMRPRVALSKQSVLQEMADRAEVELARVAVARPALAKRCERAEGILAKHVVSPRRGLIRAQLQGGELVGYLVKGSGGAVYRVEAKGSWRCSCPDHHGRHRRLSEGSRACKHGLACWALWRAAVGAPVPAVGLHTRGGHAERERAA